MPTFDADDWPPLATAEWLAQHCPPFTCPPKVAALVARKRAQEEQQKKEEEKNEGKGSAD